MLATMKIWKSGKEWIAYCKQMPHAHHILVASYRIRTYLNSCVFLNLARSKEIQGVRPRVMNKIVV